MKFPSPSRQRSIEIWQTRIDNSWGFRVVLVSDGRATDLFESRREAVMYFFHVYWQPDEKKVAIVTTGINTWQLAWDVPTRKPISFETVRKAVGKSIDEVYHVPPGQDPIRWSALSEAQSEFFKRHPEIHLTYH